MRACDGTRQSKGDTSGAWFPGVWHRGGVRLPFGEADNQCEGIVQRALLGSLAGFIMIGSMASAGAEASKDGVVPGRAFLVYDQANVQITIRSDGTYVGEFEGDLVDVDRQAAYQGASPARRRQLDDDMGHVLKSLRNGIRGSKATLAGEGRVHYLAHEQGRLPKPGAQVHPLGSPYLIIEGTANGYSFVGGATASEVGERMARAGVDGRVATCVRTDLVIAETNAIIPPAAPLDCMSWQMDRHDAVVPRVTMIRQDKPSSALPPENDQPAKNKSGPAKPALVRTDSTVEAAVAAWARNQGVSPLDEPVIAKGDGNGDGIQDAVAFLATHAGGASGAYLNLIFLRGSATGYAAVWAKRVVGADVRNARITQGVVEWDGTFLAPGDAHCCPTGKKHYREAIPAAAAAPAPVATPPTSASPAPTVSNQPTAYQDQDAQAKAAFRAFLQKVGPAHLTTGDVFDRMVNAQMVAQRAPDGQPVKADSSRPAITITPRLPLHNAEMQCRVYDAVAAATSYSFVGCIQNSGIWFYGIFKAQG